jgi:hypothetical protein
MKKTKKIKIAGQFGGKNV